MPFRAKFDVTVRFLCLMGDRVTWGIRPGVYVVIWRRWHEGQIGTHNLYGIMKEDEANNPLGHVYTAIERDLKRL